MNVLVVSDSHGSSVNFSHALEREKDCPLVFFLGDGEADFEKMKLRFPERSFIGVRGNNDYCSTLEEFAYKHIEGNTLVMCHGHTIGVKRSLHPLLEKAESVRANVALYGHTHRSDVFLTPTAAFMQSTPALFLTGITPF